jgi:hypothetical protein
VPRPPGTTKKSIFGEEAKLKLGITSSPPVAITVSDVPATVKTLKGALSSDRRDTAPGVKRVREKTSNGPAKSKTSTFSKMSIPTFNFFKTRSSSIYYFVGF